MPFDRPAARTALLAGATGLVGRALLPRLLDEPAYRQVLVLARGPAPDRAREPRLEWEQVDFDALPDALPPVHDAYITLGTTIKVAGSEAAFRRVDFDYVIAVARAARVAGATRLGIVSALGADSKSRVFYNRVKGDTEAALQGLGFETLVIAQPSMLIGDRAALGQPVRRGEVAVARWLGPVMSLVPRGVRPIAALDVAAALHAAVRDAGPGVHRLGSARMQGAAEG